MQNSHKSVIIPPVIANVCTDWTEFNVLISDQKERQ